MNKLKTHHSGLSLIELLVALALSLMIMAGAISILGSNKRVYKDQEEMSRLQEGARFSIELLNKDIRSAGFAGCADTVSSVQNDITATATNLLSYINIVEGSENGGAWQPSTGNTPVGLAGTDGITIRTIKPIEVSVSAATSATLVPAASTSDIAANDSVAVFDCTSANIFTATGTTGGLQGVGITNTYDTTAEIATFYAIRYYIATGANGQPALFRYGLFSGTESAQELISGVDNMQILYGEDTTTPPNGIADTYVNATTVADWDNVLSVRVSILVNGVNENFRGNQNTSTYSLLGTTVGPYNDFRRRKVFTNTIQIRNRTN